MNSGLELVFKKNILQFCTTVSLKYGIPQKELECLLELNKPDNSSYIDSVYNYISSITDDRIILLKQRQVVQWLFGDLTFLKSNRLNYKLDEDKWGRNTLKIRRPDLKLDKQWTNKFGEHLCEEMYILGGKTIFKPSKKDNYQPDFEIDTYIIEVKTQTFHTSGTAGEKILGVPFKYADVPDLYSKPLKILCIGGAEKICREQYGNLHGKRCTGKKKDILDFLKKEYEIEFIGATDILKSLINL
jgi:hypothetical protein